MRSPFVVELDPPADAGAGVGARGVLRQIDLLIFERAPQPLDEDVIHPAALAVHRDVDPSVREPVGEGQACELAPLVGVEDLGGPVAFERLGHRDLKPANIKVKDDGTVKVLDFGLAKALDTTPQGDPSQSPTLTAAATQMGAIMGTAAYMSPEQARGKPVERRSDVWAFGVVLYEMLTGQQLFLHRASTHPPGAPTQTTRGHVGLCPRESGDRGGNWGNSFLGVAEAGADG